MASPPQDTSDQPPEKKTPASGKKAAVKKALGKKALGKKALGKKAAAKKAQAKPAQAKPATTKISAKRAKSKTPAKKSPTKPPPAKKTRVKAAQVKIAKPTPPAPQSKENGPEENGPKKNGVGEHGPREHGPREHGAGETPSPSASVSVPKDPVPASLQHMPVALFGAGLGLAGFATAWREASVAFEGGGLLAIILAGIAFGIFATLVALYFVKFLRHRSAVLAEFRHPVMGNYFAAATMTLMILSTNLAADARELATLLWMIGAVGNVFLTISILTFWIARDCHISHATPVWFIPVVSNMAIPIVGAPLGYPDLGWMMFAVGLLFWLTLFIVVFYRLLFERPLEDPLRPSLFILMAPPSLAFIAYAVLNGGVVDGLAKMFFGIATFILLVLVPQIPYLLRLRFGLNWWSYSFPLAAYSVACTLYADAGEGEFPRYWAIGVIAALSVLMLVLAVKTARLILAGKVFRPVEAPLPKP